MLKSNLVNKEISEYNIKRKKIKFIIKIEERLIFPIKNVNYNIKRAFN